MGKPGAFLDHDRQAHGLRPVEERTADFEELYVNLDAESQRVQASRCMMCGVAFCQMGASFGTARPSGCPLHNLIPEWNELVWRGQWEQAAARLALTSPMPEFTSRVCPALCEAACNLGRVNDEPTTIHDNERAISDWEWAHGGPRRFGPAAEDAPCVAVVGSGPAGLVAAWELARRGARVTVVERSDRAGGLLMYGIPNMKLPKDVVERRTSLMEELGIEFLLNTDASQGSVAEGLARDFDAVVVAVGAGAARGISAEHADAPGVVLAVDYLTDSTKAVLSGEQPALSAAGLDVVVIGGGDTGNDCVGTAVRQGARSVRQLEFMPALPERRLPSNPWPEWPLVRKTDYGQEEAIALMGGEMRTWAQDTVAVELDDGGHVRALRVVDLDWTSGSPVRIEGSEHEIPAQLVLIACGFTGPERGVLDALGVAVATEGRPLPITAPDSHRCVKARNETFQVPWAGRRASAGVPDSSERDAEHVSCGSSETPPIYVAGDARTGSSLVVNAMADALACAREVADALGL